MASYRERVGRDGKKRVQAIVKRNGAILRTKTFDTKTAAEAWAGDIEAEFRATKQGLIPPNKTFGDLLARYRDEVSVTKGGAKWEQTRINMFLKDDIARVPLTTFCDLDVIAWRDRRKAEVSGETIRREWNIMCSAVQHARTEWKWMHSNPFRGEVKRPKGSAPRKRRPAEEETTELLKALGCDPQMTPTTISARVGYAYLFAIQTGMRAGEIVNLKWSEIKGRVAHLPHTKNGHDRDVPLTKEALRLLSFLPRSEQVDSVFSLNSGQLDALFRKARDKAGVTGLHFHDTRREALTRLSDKVDVLTLAKISGHRDLKILQNTYYAPKMEDVAGLLD